MFVQTRRSHIHIWNDSCGCYHGDTWVGVAAVS